MIVAVHQAVLAARIAARHVAVATQAIIPAGVAVAAQQAVVRAGVAVPGRAVGAMGAPARVHAAEAAVPTVVVEQSAVTTIAVAVEQAVVIAAVSIAIPVAVPITVRLVALGQALLGLALAVPSAVWLAADLWFARPRGVLWWVLVAVAVAVGVWGIALFPER